MISTKLPALLCCLLAAPGQASAVPLPAGSPARAPLSDPAEVEASEDLADSLTRDLIRVCASLRAGDAAALASLLAADLAAAPFPSLPGPLVGGSKWIAAHSWSARPATAGEGGAKGRRQAAVVIAAVGREVFLGQVSAFLAHFSAIEDVRCDVEGAELTDRTPPTGEAGIAFQIVGRDEAGRREWVRGRIDAEVRDGGGGWGFTRWTTEALASEVSVVDLFTEVSAPAGIRREAPPPAAADPFVPSGGAVADVDGDGLMDLLLTEPEGARLYVNDGAGGFRDVSGSAGLRKIPRSIAAVFLDFDADGDDDIFMSAEGPQVLLENRIDPNGIRVFRDVSAAAGVAVRAVGRSVAVADVNNDSLPDVFVASYNHYGSIVPSSWSRATNGTPDLLFVNIGSGRFRESARAWGVEDSRWGSAAAFADVNGDGWQDLYVANDFGENALYVNKRLRFEDEAARRGVQDPGSGSGVSWGDFDNDGDLDLHVSRISSAAGRRILGRLVPAGAAPPGERAEGGSLFQDRGNGWFTDLSARAGPFRAGWAHGGGFLDFDNDGWDDILSVNGFLTGRGEEEAEGLFWRHVAASADGSEKAGGESFRSEQMGRIFEEGLSLGGRERDALFMGRGDGTFRDISGISGIDSGSDGRGAIFADFDNDGDLDVVTTTARDGGRLLFRNDVGQENGFLRVSLVGTRSGRRPYGATVRLKTSRGIQTRILAAGSGFVSSHDPRLLFGLGLDERAEWLEVTWPSGLKQRASGIQAGDSLEITEGAEATRRVSETRFRLGDSRRLPDTQ